MENVTRVLRLREERKTRPFVVLQFIYMMDTKEQVRDFRRFFASYRYDAIRLRQLTYSGNRLQDADYRNRHCSCYWLWNEPMVVSNGTVVPCCQDVNADLALGNIGEKPLRVLWQEGRIQELQRKHAAGERETIPMCKACNMYQPSAMHPRRGLFSAPLRSTDGAGDRDEDFFARYGERTSV